MYIHTFKISFAGFVWAEIKEIWEGGVDAYINDMWNVVDYFTNMLYITFMGLRACSWYIVRNCFSFVMLLL